jgi:hypothetical protein
VISAMFDSRNWKEQVVPDAHRLTALVRGYTRGEGDPSRGC